MNCINASVSRDDAIQSGHHGQGAGGSRRGVRYIAEHGSPEAARQWMLKLRQVFQSLEESPQRFPIAREDGLLPGETIRRALHFQHRILFTIEDDRVFVLRVRHGMRDELSEL